MEREPTRRLFNYKLPFFIGIRFSGTTGSPSKLPMVLQVLEFSKLYPVFKYVKDHRIRVFDDTEGHLMQLKNGLAGVLIRLIHE